MRATFKKFLKELGWREQRMPGGGYLYMDFEDRMGTIWPQIWQTSQRPDSFAIELNASVTTRRFQGYCRSVFQYKEKVSYSFFRLHYPPLRLQVPEISKEIAFDASASAVSWVKGLDLWKSLMTNLTYPNEAGPPYAVNRMIALKMAGREAELANILESLNTWDRQGFDPNVTPEIVKRVIALDVSAGL